MANEPVLYVRRGARRLNLNDRSRLWLHQDFTPPPVLWRSVYASGTSQNKTGGAKLVDRYAENRQLSFTVNVRGSSEQECRYGINLIEIFLSPADGEKVFLDFHPNPPVDDWPLWGQGGWVSYELADAVVSIGDYLQGARFAYDVDVTVSATVSPIARGKDQVPGSALGAVIDDTLLNESGISRGLRILPAFAGSGNYFDNPAFMAANWNQDWTAGANITAAQEYRKGFVVYGPYSVKLIARGTGAAPANVYYDSVTLTVATYAFSCYVRTVDGTAPTSSDCQLHYNGSDLTTTFTAVPGNPYWYRATATATGTAGAANAGIRVFANRTVWASLFQCERDSIHTFPCLGDMLGCAWAGTVHDSISSRTAGRWRLPVRAETFEIASFTIKVILRWDQPNTHGTDQQIFSMGASSIRARFNAAGDTITFTDNTNTATSGALTYSAGQEDILHFVASPAGGLVVYRNGTSIATNATYTPPTLPSYLYLGTTDSATTHLQGTFRTLEIYNRAFTSAQVTVDYTNFAALTADALPTGAIPWLWNVDGDWVIDAHLDSNQQNYFVIGGVPGSLPVFPKLRWTASAVYAVSGKHWLGIRSVTEFVPFSESNIFDDAWGSAGVDNECGGEYERFALTTTDQQILSGVVGAYQHENIIRALAGKKCSVLVTYRDAGANLRMRFFFMYTGGFQITGDWIDVPSVATYRTILLEGAVLPPVERMYPEEDSFNALSWGVDAIRSTGGPNNLDVDWGMLMPEPLIEIRNTVGIAAGSVLRLTEEGALSQATNTFPGYSGEMELLQTGDFHVHPNRINIVTSLFHPNAAPHTYTVTLYTNTYIQPAYSLLK